MATLHNHLQDLLHQNQFSLTYLQLTLIHFSLVFISCAQAYFCHFPFPSTCCVLHPFCWYTKQNPLNTARVWSLLMTEWGWEGPSSTEFQTCSQGASAGCFSCSRPAPQNWTWHWMLDQPYQSASVVTRWEDRTSSTPVSYTKSPGRKANAWEWRTTPFFPLQLWAEHR